MDQVNDPSEAGCSRGLCALPAESLNSVCQRAPRAITLQEAPPHRPPQLTLMSPLPPCLAAMSNLPPPPNQPLLSELGQAESCQRSKGH